MKYLVHSCPDRKWYVDGFLVPSLKAQGIGSDEIIIWHDEYRKGNLQSFVDSCKFVGDMPGGTWHLQDDAIICSDFAERTRKYDNGIICGFVNEVFGPDPTACGLVPIKKMWNSFPCIRIPNDIAKEFAEWFEIVTSTRTKYQNWVAQKKFDDCFFRDFIMECHEKDKAFNLKPCLVDHIDFLLGGSVINQWRGYYTRAVYWPETELIEKLKAEIKAR